MDPLLHTIALEPARWTPARASAPLASRLPAIAAAGFTRLEVYEPHLARGPGRSFCWKHTTAPWPMTPLA